MNLGKIWIVTLAFAASSLAASEFDNYATKTELIFPLTGESIIRDGGRSLTENHHFKSVDQRYALDIIAFAPGASPPTKADIARYKASKLIDDAFNGDPALNESYYCFGRTVVAPADGIVVDLKDGIPDHAPNDRRLSDGPRGNFVVIDHGNNEFSFFAHLKLSSIPKNLKKGVSVRVGEEIGKCGNSGGSWTPHLHYHLQNSPRLFDGKGLPAQFNNYLSNGKLVVRGEPVQGQIITSQPHAND